MRPLGTTLLALGVTLGAVVGIGMLLGVSLPGLPWIVAVGLVKLTLIAAGGLMAGGAILHSLAKRSEQRRRLEPPAADDVATVDGGTTDKS